MNISSISGLNTDFQLNDVDTSSVANNNEAFSSLLDSAMNMLKETNQYQVNAQQAALNYALGYTDDTATLMAAQAKAMTSLQYTVAVKNKFLEAYKEIMSIQL
ncbi:MAG: flagellar hook-basal body complex protein FliE [Lachnospiraceae bacterium]|nr:flagellar hook-basal body complex protein FliE [Lachnospiraceae bacterium]MEE1341119.1 flagellar hook-basal body complex protein FliE [Lachnospiraceae bacterium]